MSKIRFDPTLPLRYLRYARMSTEMQNPRSPEQQFQEIDRQLRRAGHPWVHVADYRDNALSGRLMRKRPSFCKMLEDIKTGRVQIDVVLLDMIERFGRMQELPALRLELQTKHGVLLLGADSSFADPTSIAGEALGMVEHIRATTFGHALAHNVKRGKLDSAMQKHWPGGPAPLGLKLQSVMKLGVEPAEVDYRVPVRDPATAPIILEIFRLAHEKGYGGFRIAKYLNSDQKHVAKYGTISGSSVNFILGNPIYVGMLRYNQFETGIADDRRVSVRNDESDVVYIEDFCEPLIDRKVYEAVQEIRRARSERITSARARKQDPNCKQIKPVAPGVVLKYPLTGLVRCGECGGAMQPNSSRYGKKIYMSYYCPHRVDGRCTNSRGVAGDWLWSVFCARLRERLFPLSTNDDGGAPPWLNELIAELRAELHQRAAQRQDQRPLLERDVSDLAAKITGWTQTLANPNLDVAVRVHIEQEFYAAIAHKRKVEADLAGLVHEVERADRMLKVDDVIERLRQLSDLLKNANPTALNVELSRHVEQIVVHTDGRVAMRTHRLGVFEGVIELLAIPAGQEIDGAELAAGTTQNGAVKPRSVLLTRRDSGNSVMDHARSVPRVTLGMVKLPDKWVDEHVVQIPRRQTFSHIRGKEVLKMKQQTGWSNVKLAEHFEVSPPTIRRALQIAGQLKSSGADGQSAVV